MRMILALLAKISPWYDEKAVSRKEERTEQRIRRADLAYEQASRIISHKGNL